MTRPSDAGGDSTRFGFVAVLGGPNAGKSTLVNRLVGAKVSIVTPKVQTTRTRVTGIAIEGRTQMAFVDLPGIFAPRRRLDRAMVEAAWRGASEADLALLLVDAAAQRDEATPLIISGLKQRRIPAILVLNKIDLVKRPQLLEMAKRLNDAAEFTHTFMISAATGDGVADLRRNIADRLPEGPWLYPEDQISDMPERLIAAEVTREQTFLQLHRELPYSIAVETEKWEDFRDGSVRIEQHIYVRRDSQRMIVLGAGGVRIKAIGQKAREELARILGRPVHLMLHVKVAEDWAERPHYYRLWGLEFDA